MASSMDVLTGTPGSGKSMHMATLIYWGLKRKRMVIANQEINLDQFTEEQKRMFVYIPNDVLNKAPSRKIEETIRYNYKNYDDNITKIILEDLNKPEKSGTDIILDIARYYWCNHTAKNYDDAEGRILLFLDEAQLIFNSRSWAKNSKVGWGEFFSIYRKAGISVTLVTQYIENIDKQVRVLIEYEEVHRKVSNFGIMGKLIGLLFGGKLFVAVRKWSPIDKVIGRNFFIYHKKYASLYDTFHLFTGESMIRLEGSGTVPSGTMPDASNLIEDTAKIGEELTC